MSFRRIPFQFAATDPIKRHEELEKRFGFFKDKKDMRIDFEDPVLKNGYDSGPNSASSSPKLQHKRLVCHDNLEESHNCINKSMEMTGERKPRVRVIPIEVEGADCAPKRQRNLHLLPKQYQTSEKLTASSKPIDKRISSESPFKSFQESGAHDIPIKVGEQVKDNKFISPKGKPRFSKNSMPQKDLSSAEKPVLDVVPTTCQSTQKPKVKKDLNEQLNKIESILQKLEVYAGEVESFKGSSADKQYRYLDEMLTRCLLELDNVETMGKEDIRLSRKAAIKKVQCCANLLESKVNKLKEVVDNLPTAIVEESNTSVDFFKTSQVKNIFKDASISKNNEFCTTSSETDEKKVELKKDTVEICEASPKQDVINIQIEPIKTSECNIESDSTSCTSDAKSNCPTSVENSVIEMVPTEQTNKHSSESTVTEIMLEKSDILNKKDCDATVNSSNTTETIPMQNC